MNAPIQIREVLEVVAVVAMLLIQFGVATIGTRVSEMMYRARIKRLKFKRSRVSKSMSISGLFLLAVTIYVWYVQGFWPGLAIFGCILTFGSDLIDLWQQLRIVNGMAGKEGSTS